jgi:hypothetical protein
VDAVAEEPAVRARADAVALEGLVQRRDDAVIELGHFVVHDRVPVREERVRRHHREERERPAAARLGEVARAVGRIVDVGFHHVDVGAELRLQIGHVAGDLRAELVAIDLILHLQDVERGAVMSLPPMVTVTRIGFGSVAESFATCAFMS